LSEHRSTATAPVENKQTGVQDSHVVQPKKVTPLRISAQVPGRRRSSAKNAGKTRGFEAKKTVVGGKFRGLGSVLQLVSSSSIPTEAPKEPADATQYRIPFMSSKWSTSGTAIIAATGQRPMFLYPPSMTSIKSRATKLSAISSARGHKAKE